MLLRNHVLYALGYNLPSHLTLCDHVGPAPPGGGGGGGGRRAGGGVVGAGLTVNKTNYKKKNNKK